MHVQTVRLFGRSPQTQHWAARNCPGSTIRSMQCRTLVHLAEGHCSASRIADLAKWTGLNELHVLEFALFHVQDAAGQHGPFEVILQLLLQLHWHCTCQPSAPHAAADNYSRSSTSINTPANSEFQSKDRFMHVALLCAINRHKSRPETLHCQHDVGHRAYPEALGAHF